MGNPDLSRGRHAAIGRPGNTNHGGPAIPTNGGGAMNIHHWNAIGAAIVAAVCILLAGVIWNRKDAEELVVMFLWSAGFGVAFSVVAWQEMGIAMFGGAP